jgi:tRNA G18 (ribose-2'-O)-methylase SpoU
MRGFYGIGIYHSKTETNVGTLWRSASQLGASFIFTIGKRYKQQSSDTHKTWRHKPLYHYDSFSDFQKSRPTNAELVGVELDETAKCLSEFTHPERAIYLLGAEDHGLPTKITQQCQRLITLDGGSFNVAVAGSIVMYDRVNTKEMK